jgi:FkbM family methyltransferase
MEPTELFVAEAEFKIGDITKQQYIEKMHELHKRLFDYSSFIRDRDIKEVTIKDGSVIVTTRRDGIRLLCDFEDRRIIPLEIMNFGAYEREELDMISRLIDEGFIVLDVGANVGWYSINIARRFSRVRICSFEPIPRTYGLLLKNIALNDSRNVETHNFGFSDERKDLVFYYYREGSGNASSAMLTDRKDVEKIVCKVDTIDRFVADNDMHVDFIKCDVEGAELFVFQGGLKTISRDRPMIFTEMLRKWSAKFGYHPNDIIRLLRGVGYRCFTICGDRLEEFGEMNDNTGETNFLFLHPQEHKDKINKYLNRAGATD